MKWIGVLLICFIFWAGAKTPCSLSDFYGLSMTLHNPSERHQRLSQWLITNGDNCSSEDLVIIWNNLALWAGVADSAELRGKVLYYYAKAMEREKK
jgi:hypothetical protein